MTFSSAQIVQIAPNALILLLLDENDKVITMRPFTNNVDAEFAAQLAQALAEATASTGKTIDEALEALQNMIDDLRRQEKSGKKSRRKLH